MSIADIFINIILWIINGSILKLPESISALPLSTLQSTLTSFTTSYTTAFNFIDNFMPIALIFSLLAGVILAEIALHLGWKSVKYIINVFRGSGG